MGNIFVSIIVPIYNREKTLPICLEGICSIKAPEIEIILVDDGSSDNSANVAREYAKRDTRIKLYSQPNSGVSTARNFGLSNATGSWVTFVDSDDTINAKFVDEILSYCQNNAADIVIMGGEQCHYDGNNVIRLNKKIRTISETIISSNTNVIHYYFSDYPDAVAPCWGKFFKRDILEKNKIRFRSDISLGEDLIFVVEYLKHTKSLVYSTAPGSIQFNWSSKYRTGNLTKQLRLPSNYAHNILACYNSMNELYKITNDISVHKYACNYLIQNLILSIVYNYGKLCNLRKIGFNKYKKTLISEIKPIISSHVDDIKFISNHDIAETCWLIMSDKRYKLYYKLFIIQNILSCYRAIRKSISINIISKIKGKTNDIISLRY